MRTTRLHDTVARGDPETKGLGQDFDKWHNSYTPVRRHCEGLTGAYKILCCSKNGEPKLSESASQCTIGTAIPDSFRESVAQTAPGGPFYKLTDKPPRLDVSLPQTPFMANVSATSAGG